MKNKIYIGPIAICKFETKIDNTLEERYLTCPNITCERYLKQLKYGINCNLCGYSLILLKQELKISNIDIQTLIQDIGGAMIEMSSNTPQIETNTHYWLPNYEDEYHEYINFNDEVLHIKKEKSISDDIENFKTDYNEELTLIEMMYGNKNVSIVWAIISICQ